MVPNALADGLKGLERINTLEFSFACYELPTIGGAGGFVAGGGGGER